MTRLFATLVLALSGVGTAVAAGCTYDEEDPFHERERIARFRQLGGDVAQEVDLEFKIDFKDRPETREHYATIFAAKLRRLGYPTGSLLKAFEQFATIQCDGTRAKMERDAEQAS